jgi:hypothetical protein
MKRTAVSVLLFLSLSFVLKSCSEKDANPVLTIEGGQIQGVETHLLLVMAVGKNRNLWLHGRV